MVILSSTVGNFNFGVPLSFFFQWCMLCSQVKERPDVGVYVKDLSAFVVNNADDMDRIMTLGNKNSKSVFPGCVQDQQ